MSGGGRVWPLAGNQRPAVDPGETVWLSASAGTGKTQVLSARVLRLLLEDGVSPDQVLCLTFTKAGATEMAARINQVLARWVRLEETKLAVELLAIGAGNDQATIARARTLFASVLDCPGGGLRIDTIHAFAQWLLATFPAEAGLVPGVRALDDRDSEILKREVLGRLLLDAEEQGDEATLNGVAVLSERYGPDGVLAFLMRCAAARDAWFGPGAWQPPLAPRVRTLLGLAQDAGEADLIRLCEDDAFDVEALRLCLSAYSQWSAKTGQTGRAVIADWLSATPRERLERLPDLHDILFTKKDTVRSTASLNKFEEHFEHAAGEVLRSSLAVRELRALIELAERLVPALELGRRFALAWDEAKSREGFIDFDDQIRQAADLLTQQNMADWVRYKLDRQIDHILVDEAQDTNAAQWRIIDALTEEFFSGEGAHGNKLRTLFVVGDYKQAIFRFQGTSPENFEAARQRVKAAMEGLARNAAALRGNGPLRELQEYDLGESFRTAVSVLEFVDMAIGRIGHAGFGLDRPPAPHVGQVRPGHVSLWGPVTPTPGEEVEDEGEGPAPTEEGGEGWLSLPERQMADRLARQVRDWIDQGLWLHKHGRRLTAGDVMVLVRRRGELASLIVGRLHAHGVPVAGVDRLRLGAPLGVRDLMAALRFAAQPLDDLNLAALLVSPLIGWSQEQLLAYAWRDEKVRLWEHLRGLRDPEAVAAVAQLLDLLRLADYEPPQAMLHWLLVGPWQGRRKLVARLGREANDPIDELLNAASAYAATSTPSLQGFIRWFDAGEGELKREAGEAGDLVRVMTVHGSKGLQAPVVILADATGKPGGARSGGLNLAEPRIGEFGELDEPRRIPLPPVSQAEQAGRVREQIETEQRAELEEHWRLLYVAMTRAEEALFIGGALGKRGTEPDPDSWYARLEATFPAQDWIEDPVWGRRLEYGQPLELAVAETAGATVANPPELPEWLTRPLAPEPRPPRPLAPSALGEELETDPPFPPGVGREAARRGVLIHKLLERLPALDAARREGAAQAWLARNAADLDAAARDELAKCALAVLAEPGWQDLFGPDSLAEVPIAALVGERVLAGMIDRLLIGAERIRLVDFKTARRPPAGIGEVPASILRQMAAYAAALEAAYPGRVVEAALLYTQTPLLIEIPPQLLAAHKQALTGAQE